MTALTAGLRSPAWWRSGTRTPLWWAALLSYCLFASLDWYAQAQHGQRVSLLADTASSETAETAVGLLFWMWRPRNIVGPLLVAYVQVSMLNDLPFDAPHSRLALTVGFLFYYAWIPVYVLMLLVFPNGQLWTRGALWFVAVTAAVDLVEYVPLLLFGDLEPPSYFYLGHGWGGLDTWNRATWGYGIVWWLVLDAFLITRLVRATPGARRRLAPLYLLLLLVSEPFYLYACYLGVRGEPWPTWLLYQLWAFFFWSAIGAAFGLGLVRRARGSVADLVVELGEIEPGHVREALARTLGDPTLELGLWLPERGIWVDERGSKLVVPSGDERGVTHVGERLALMVHDRDLLDQPRLLEAAGSAARLALENERLQAQLRAQLVELRDSRARIVKTADEERRRLERDLHDGAQQRLLGVGLRLQLLRSRLNGNQPAIELLDETESEVQGALSELRELARGIHPAVLTDQGLEPALRTLADRAPIPVAIDANDQRLPAHIETAIYFLVAEALTNITKHAHASKGWVSIHHQDHTAHVEVRDNGVGGASASGGSGLRGLADRVGALNGSLLIDSPAGGGTRITAEIPCAS